MLYMDKGVCSECNVICYVFRLRLLYTVLDVSDVTTKLESQLSFSSFRGKPKHIASSSHSIINQYAMPSSILSIF
jgi:hypothetical protein